MLYWLLHAHEHIVCNKTLICSYTCQKLPAHTSTGGVGVWMCNHASTEQCKGDPLGMQEILSSVQPQRTKYIHITAYEFGHMGFVHTFLCVWLLHIQRQTSAAH